ncbi:hypothetical protein N7520_003332 [Penicillium odoratum]|uniref:uncharacterized protein n=1 Tax=Penicillium odoratum TaxID=1167516 RepID=UPI002546AC74|nr:uncharacterized protein N7520_003332 [Penicillium odoratum]KAJ5768773.1 hypothetical protein N7520_003332 [Penicillium odoratum]
MSQREADRILFLKSRERESRACYPCRKRKVKCDGKQPCQTCQKRKHPQICDFDIPHSRRRSVSRQPARSASPVRQPVIEDEPPAQNDSSKNYVYSGDNSVVSILRLRASDANSMAHDVGSVLGLQNTFDSYPFMDSKTPTEKWKSLLGILPQRSEILKYDVYKFFHYYQVTAYPYNPILADMDRFEADLCTYLNAHALGEFKDPGKISDRWATEKSIGHISLLLATLASGAHYSDLEYSQRSELAMDFTRRSFHALRLANFLFRPSLDVIQALLIIGNTLQNMAQSDAAWALLGSTVRLAQTMGLHTEKSTSYWPEYLRAKAKKLWSTIVWQDSLLCLCYDRPPIVSVVGWPLDQTMLERTDLTYPETMHFLCRLGLDMMRPGGQTEVDRAIDSLQKLDSVGQRSQKYLRNRESCMTFQQNLEHLALRMHTNFCISVACRPAMKQQPQPLYPQADFLRMRAKGGLIDASKAFLDFQALSVVPLRSWSMVHTVLSSTLLLCIWEETRNDPECRRLQQRVIDVFSSSNAKTAEGTPCDGDEWLSARHIRALVTLRSTLDREGDRSSIQPDQGIGFETGIPPSNPDGYGYMPDMDPFGISPVTYLDSIMNGMSSILTSSVDANFNSPFVRFYTRKWVPMSGGQDSIIATRMPAGTTNIGFTVSTRAKYDCSGLGSRDLGFGNNLKLPESVGTNGFYDSPPNRKCCYLMNGWTL